MERRDFSGGVRRQEEWRLPIIVALFLTGSGAGLFFFSLIIGLLSGMALGVFSIMTGCLFLLADLHRPRAAWRLIFRPQTSWMSRGVIGITSFTILACLHIVFLATDLHGGATLGLPWAGESAEMKALGIAAGIGALFVSCYPGFLLGDIRPISFWNGAYLPALFLASSLLGGLGVLYVLPLNWESFPWLGSLAKIGMVLIIFELLLLLGLILMSHRDTTRQSVSLLTSGSLRFPFLFGVLGAGLIAPLVIIILVSLGVGIASYLIYEGLLHLIGVFFLRYTILRAGVQALPS